MFYRLILYMERGGGGAGERGRGVGGWEGRDVLEIFERYLQAGGKICHNELCSLFPRGRNFKN